MQFWWFHRVWQVKTYNRQFVPHNLRYGDEEEHCGIFYLYIRETLDTETYINSDRGGVIAALKKRLF